MLHRQLYAQVQSTPYLQVEVCQLPKVLQTRNGIYAVAVQIQHSHCVTILQIADEVEAFAFQVQVCQVRSEVTPGSVVGTRLADVAGRLQYKNT